jgi:hypothetical protein
VEQRLLALRLRASAVTRSARAGPTGTASLIGYCSAAIQRFGVDRPDRRQHRPGLGALPQLAAHYPGQLVGTYLARPRPYPRGVTYAYQKLAVAHRACGW